MNRPPVPYAIFPRFFCLSLDDFSHTLTYPDCPYLLFTIYAIISLKAEGSFGMPIPLAIIVLLLLFVSFFFTGRLYVFVLLFVYHAYAHLSKQIKSPGKWQIDTAMLPVYLMAIAFLAFVLLFFPFFPHNFSNMIKFSLFMLAVCCYFFILSLKKS